MGERRAADSDELARMIAEDEANDAAVALAKMRINDYARARGIAPQRVHYYIRNKKLARETCACGVGVIDVAAADIALGFRKAEDVDHEGRDSEGDQVSGLADGAAVDEGDLD